MSQVKLDFKQVRAVLKNTTQALKQEFKTAQCLLLISVGQEAHEGERFAATIELINASFSSCVISLYDGLQRYTMALNSERGPEDFYACAVKEGDLWLERNKKYYSRLSIPLKITRGETWLHHQRYSEQHDELKTMLDRNTIYKTAFNSAIDGYLSKYTSRLDEASHFNYNRAQLLCFDYILEECTILCLWPELQCQFEIYPSRHNVAMEATRECFIYTRTPHLMRPMQLDFRNANKMKPQYFEVLHQEK